MCRRAFHVVVEQICIHSEAAVSLPYTVLWLWFRNLLICPFALLLLFLSSPVASLFGTFRAELGGVRRALYTTGFVSDLPSFSSSSTCYCLKKETEDNRCKKSVILILFIVSWQSWRCVQVYICAHGKVGVQFQLSSDSSTQHLCSLLIDNQRGWWWNQIYHVYKDMYYRTFIVSDIIKKVYINMIL